MGTGSRAGCSPGPLSTVIALSNGQDHALILKTAGNDRRRCLRPATGTTKRERKNIVALLVTLKQSLDNDIIRDISVTAEDTVGIDGGFVGDTTDVEGVARVGTDDTTDVRSVTLAARVGFSIIALASVRTKKYSLHGIGIGNRVVGTGVSITNEVITTDDLVARAKSSTEERVGVVNTGIDAMVMKSEEGFAEGWIN